MRASTRQPAAPDKTGGIAGASLPAVAPWVAAVQPLDRSWTLLAVAGIAALTVRRWMLLGPYPPGLDGAQWIAIGRGFHGYGRATEGAYAPLVPALATLLDAVTDSLTATRLLSVLSGLAVSLAIWLVLRSVLGPGWGLAAAAVAIPASAIAEPLFYGGYPQTMALTFGLIALLGTCRFLVSGGSVSLGIVGLGSLGAAASHHVYYPLLAMGIVVAVLLRASDRVNRLDWRRLSSLLLAIVPSAAVFGIVVFSFVAAGYSAPLDASARSAGDAWQYATREATPIWTALLFVAGASLVTGWRSRGEVAWLLSTSLMLPAGALLLLSGQPRLAPPLLVGIALAAAMGARRVAASGFIAALGSAALALVVAIVLVGPADRAAAHFAGFYEVVDQSMVDAAAAIEADGGDGAVAVRQDRRGWPIGWWVEALLERPVVVGSDRRWLGFPEEWEAAARATALFDGELDADTFRARAVEAGTRYLLIPKWDWIGWERWMSAPDFPATVLYDDDRYLVLRTT